RRTAPDRKRPHRTPLPLCAGIGPEAPRKTFGGRHRVVLMPDLLRITVLGSGTSSGVPTIGCGCATCASTDPRDNRLRPSVLMQYAGKNVLIDTTPDFR